MYGELMSSKNSKVIICIPARFGSTRFPGKVLAELGGKPIIQWIYERALKTSADEVIIATDNKNVANAVNCFGGKYVMTSPEHPSGTDRTWEAVKNKKADIIVNIQGDEPLININTVEKLISVMKEKSDSEMGTVVIKSDRKTIGKDPNVVKAVLSKDNMALYFSRSEVPYDREEKSELPLYHHVGIYAYKYHILKKFVSLEQSPLEQCEKLEQLRALENGISIYSVITDEYNGIGIDTPADLESAERYIKENNVRD